MSSVDVMEGRRGSSNIDIEQWFMDEGVLSDVELLDSPISVDGDKLVVDSNKLDYERVYSFNYLAEEMVLWRNKNNDIEIFQVIER